MFQNSEYVMHWRWTRCIAPCTRIQSRMLYSKILGTSHSNPQIKRALAYLKRWENIKFLFATILFPLNERFVSTKCYFPSIFVWCASLSLWFFYTPIFLFEIISLLGISLSLMLYNFIVHTIHLLGLPQI